MVVAIETVADGVRKPQTSSGNWHRPRYGKHPPFWRTLPPLHGCGDGHGCLRRHVQCLSLSRWSHPVITTRGVTQAGKRHPRRCLLARSAAGQFRRTVNDDCVFISFVLKKNLPQPTVAQVCASNMVFRKVHQHSNLGVKVRRVSLQNMMLLLHVDASLNAAGLVGSQSGVTNQSLLEEKSAPWTPVS